MQPFLDHYLKDAPKPNTPRVLVYETGADQWHRYDAWPRACAEGCLVIVEAEPVIIEHRLIAIGCPVVVLLVSFPATCARGRSEELQGRAEILTDHWFPSIAAWTRTVRVVRHD
jgi:hypothetical protein